MKKTLYGFTMVELMVVVTIISILAGVMYVNFSDVRAESRDKVRQNTLLEMQVALELYKSQYEVYPDQGCDTGSGWAGPGPSGCDEYIVGLAPDFISALPRDLMWENEVGRGYRYQVNASRSAYKLLSYQAAEADLVDDYNHYFSRCPSNNCGVVPLEDTTYAVYSFGAEEW
jgi:prepilin-type N-terminal cleavage/methylation domain-containing protein